MKLEKASGLRPDYAREIAEVGSWRSKHLSGQRSWDRKV